MKNKIAVVGATGLVGKEMCQILSEQGIRSGDFLKVSRSMQDRRDNGCVPVETALKLRPEYVFLATGDDVSRELVPQFREAGSTIIDKSDAFRMNEDIPLIVPEINGYVMDGLETIISTPNCTTTQLVMVLGPIHSIFRIKRVVVSTYQSVSGSGKDALLQLNKERFGEKTEPFYPHAIDNNLIPACDSFLTDGYTKEEQKIVQESGKILMDRSIRISATAVRVPISRSHGMSVNIEFYDDFDLLNIKNALNSNSGIRILDEPEKGIYPMPINASGGDKVLVGRIRRDHSCDFGLNLWIVADNLRKGAALNAYQIMKTLELKRGNR
ncbi:MAG: aspartate-semialdehyde dehydrogenase [Patescibacteria group bacterium]|jgi:aspartate-semialdehyde dehydrogenase|nr:aspartate-semialdehyde dehydrogenase [Patescibacteria group bacterium]